PPPRDRRRGRRGDDLPPRTRGWFHHRHRPHRRRRLRGHRPPPTRTGHLTSRGAPMKTRLNCPCGEYITGTDADDLVAKAQAHLAAEHPGREYDRDAILFMAG